MITYTLLTLDLIPTTCELTGTKTLFTNSLYSHLICDTFQLKAANFYSFFLLECYKVKNFKKFSVNKLFIDRWVWLTNNVTENRNGKPCSRLSCDSSYSLCSNFPFMTKEQAVEIVLKRNLVNFMAVVKHRLMEVLTYIHLISKLFSSQKRSIAHFWSVDNLFMTYLKEKKRENI